MTSTLPSFSCTLCSSTSLEYEFMVEGYPLYRCKDCNFMFLNPSQPDNRKDIPFVKDDLKYSGTDDELADKRKLTYDTARRYIDQLRSYSGQSGNTMLEIGGHDNVFIQVAKEQGFETTNIRILNHQAIKENTDTADSIIATDNVENAVLPESFYDVCVVRDELHYHPDPLKYLHKIHSLLKPEGVLLLTTPSVDSWSAKIMRQNWIKFNAAHLYYFDKQTIQNALAKSGFHCIHVDSDKKYFSLEYLKNQFEKYQIPFYNGLIAFLYSVSPWSIRKRRFFLPLSGIMVLCRATEIRKRPLLSIIMPVYNEQKTFPVVMELLLKKEIPNVEKEIIIVESNSKDGTREEVFKYKNVTNVKIVLEETPKGKGHAVRTGFKHVTGDFILIQDGDLEYDLNDYDILLEPLISGKAAFVLGTRHDRSWKIRKFQHQRYFLADILNLAHWFFVGLINVFYWQSMTDPFTMYKVFRRDCIFGLKFECDRFNFDHELVCKILRKGYIPLEIPVNYTARSFDEGKKVRLFRDPPTWIKAIFKYRFIKVYFPFDHNQK